MKFVCYTVVSLVSTFRKKSQSYTVRDLTKLIMLTLYTKQSTGIERSSVFRRERMHTLISRLTDETSKTVRNYCIKDAIDSFLRLRKLGIRAHAWV